MTMAYPIGSWVASTITTTSPRAQNDRASQFAAFAAARTDWQSEAQRRLAYLIRLPEGWDGHQGRPVVPTIAEYAYHLMEALLLRPGVPMPSITPLSYGGLVLEWHRKGWDVEIEIDAPASHCVYTHDLASGAEEDFRLGYRLERLKHVVAKIAD